MPYSVGLHKSLIESSFFAPRGHSRIYNLGMQIAQLYLSPYDKLIGFIGDAGSGKSALVKGMFPGVELTNDDDGVNVRPLPLLDLDDSRSFYQPHTYHLDIRFEMGFTQPHVLADAIIEALARGKRVLVEHFDLIYPLLHRNADLMIGVGEQIIISRPTIFGPEPVEFVNVVHSSLPYRLMAHTAEDLCEMHMSPELVNSCVHDDVHHGFVLAFREDHPEIDLAELERLQKQHLISFQTLGHGNVVRYKICDWARHNTVLEYNAPCQKDTGFFFLPVSVATDLISSDRCSEMDIVLDLWVSAIYNDNQVQGSDLGPVVYFRNGTGNPLVTYTELAARWGLSRATVGRVLKKLAALDYISLMSFPGRHGSVIYLQKYLSTMFEISDVMVDKEEVAMTLNIRLELPKEDSAGHDAPALEHEVIVSDELASVSKSHIEIILQKMAQILMAQGISCFGCPLSRYKLYPLSGDCREDLLPRARERSLLRFGLAVLCGNKQVATFELTLSPSVEN